MVSCAAACGCGGLKLHAAECIAQPCTGCRLSPFAQLPHCHPPSPWLPADEPNPTSYVSPDGEWTGFEAQLLQAINRTNLLPFGNITFLDSLDERITALLDGEVDAVLGGEAGIEMWMRGRGLMHNTAPYRLLNAAMQCTTAGRSPRTMPAAFSVIPECKENVTFVG